MGDGAQAITCHGSVLTEIKKYQASGKKKRTVKEECFTVEEVKVAQSERQR